MTCASSSGNISDFYRGTTKTYAITVEKDGSPVDITGASIVATFKSDLSLADIDAEIQKAGVILDGPNGSAQVTLEATDTQVEPGTYHYDFVLTEVGGEVTVLLAGEVAILDHAND